LAWILYPTHTMMRNLRLNPSIGLLSAWNLCGWLTICALASGVALADGEKPDGCGLEMKRPQLVMPKQLSALEAYNPVTQDISANLIHLDLLLPGQVLNPRHTMHTTIEYTLSQHWDLFLSLPGGQQLLEILADPFFQTVPREFMQRELSDWAKQNLDGTELIFNTDLENPAMSHTQSVIPGEVYFDWISNGKLPIIDVHDLMAHMSIYSDTGLRRSIQRLAGLMLKTQEEHRPRIDLTIWRPMGEKVPFFYQRADGTPTMTVLGGPIVTYRPNITDVTRRSRQSQDPEPSEAEWNEIQLGLLSYINDFAKIRKQISAAKLEFPEHPRLKKFLTRYEEFLTGTSVFASIDEFHKTLDLDVKKHAKAKVARIRNESANYQDFWIRLRRQVDLANPSSPEDKYLSLLSPQWHRPLMQWTLEFELLMVELRLGE
jgi:hypothetical protein